MLTMAILPAPMSGCAAYRLLLPLIDLRQRGEIRLLCSIAYPGDGEWKLQPVGDAPFERIAAATSVGPFALAESDVECADVVVIQKSGGLRTGQDNEAGLLETVRAHARKFVYEVDDDLEHVTKDNPCWTEELQHNPGYAQRMRAMASACRLVTVTTPHLADVMRRVNPEVRVVPNGVDLATWRPEGYHGPTPKAVGDPLRIGWIASRNHVEDARILQRPWRRIAALYPQVTFVLAGAFYSPLKEALGDRLEFHNGVSFVDYAEWCRALHLDIAVAPLFDSPFARSKSALKAIEAAAMGVPIVCSDVEPYRAIRGPILCRAADDWVRALSSLIEDPAKRAAVAAEALSDVSERWTLERSADAWLEVLREAACP